MNRLLVLPFHERRAARERLRRNEPLWGPGAFSLVSTGTTTEDPGWQAKEPEPPPNPLARAYGLLCLQSGATAAEVKAAFKRLAFEHHPDRGGEARKFAEVVEAKNVLLAYIEEGKLP